MYKESSMDFYTTLFTQIIELNIIIVSLLMSIYSFLIVLVIHNFLLLLERVLMQHNNKKNKNKNCASHKPISSTYKQLNLNHVYKHISNNYYLMKLFIQIHTFYTYSFYWLHQL